MPESKNAKSRKQVISGDRLRLEQKFNNAKGQWAFGKAVATVDGNLAGQHNLALCVQTAEVKGVGII